MALPLSFLPERSLLRTELQQDRAYGWLEEIELTVAGVVDDRALKRFFQTPGFLNTGPDLPPLADTILESVNRLMFQVVRGASRQQDPSRPMSTAEKNAQRKACMEQIGQLHKGLDILSWTKDARAVINKPEVTLPDDEKLNVLRSKSKETAEVARMIDNHSACKDAKKPEQYLQQLEVLFRARDIEFQTALSNWTQPSNMPAVEFIEKVAVFAKEYWAPLPEGVNQCIGIINNMSDKHRPYMMSELNTFKSLKTHQKGNDVEPLTYGTLLTWARQSDAEYSRNSNKAQGKSNFAQGKEGKKNNNNSSQGFQRRNWNDLNQGKQFPKANVLQVLSGLEPSTPTRSPVILQIVRSPQTPMSEQSVRTPVCKDVLEFHKYVISSPKAEQFMPVVKNGALNEDDLYVPEWFMTAEEKEANLLAGKKIDVGVQERLAMDENEVEELQSQTPLVVNMMFGTDGPQQPHQLLQIGNSSVPRYPFEGNSSPQIMTKIVQDVFQLPQDQALEVGQLMFDSGCFPFVPAKLCPESLRFRNFNSHPDLVADFEYLSPYDTPMVLKKSWEGSLVLVLPGIRRTRDGVFLDIMSGKMAEPFSLRIPIDVKHNQYFPDRRGVLSSTNFVCMLYASGPDRQLREAVGMGATFHASMAQHYHNAGTSDMNPLGPFHMPCVQDPTVLGDPVESEGERACSGMSESAQGPRMDQEMSRGSNFHGEDYVPLPDVSIPDDDSDVEIWDSYLNRRCNVRVGMLQACATNSVAEEHLPLTVAMMGATNDLETTLYLATEADVEVYAANLRPNRNRPRNAEPFRREDEEEKQQGGKYYLPMYARPEIKLAGAVFSTTLAGLVVMWRNPNMTALVDALGKVIDLKDSRVIEEAREAIQSVAVAAKQLQTSAFPGVGNVGCSDTIVKRCEGMDMICPQAIEEDYAPFLGAITPQSLIKHGTATMPALSFTFENHKEERIAHLDTGCNISIVSTRAMLRDRNMYGDACRISRVRPFTIQFADGRTTSAAHLAVQDAMVIIGKCKYQVDLIVMENLSTEYLFGFPWFVTYDAQIKPFDRKVSIGVEKKSFIGNEKHYQPYQEVDLSFSIKLLTLYPKD
jgi:hypothetical protein